MLGEGLTFGIVPLKNTAERVLDEATALNDMPNGMTFSRGTSAWDPYFNKIVAPGVRRQRPASIGRFRAFKLDLIEGAGASLLPSGSSENPGYAWGGSNLTFNFNQPSIDGGLTAALMTVVSSAVNTAINLGFTASAAVYTCQIALKATPTTAISSFSIYQAGHVATTARVLSGPGVIVNGATGTPAYISGLSTTQWTVVSITTAAALSAGACSVYFYPDGSPAGGTVAGHAIYADHVFLEQSAFPTSYVSNRNFVLYSNVLNGTGWGNGGSSATIASGGGTLPSGETAWTFTAGASFGDWQRTINVSAGAVMTYSFWAKSGTLALPGCLVYDNIHFANIVAPNISSQINTSTFSRVTVTFTVPAGCTQIIICPGYSLGGTGTTFIGDCQLEYGNVATAYWGVDATVGGRDVETLSVPYAMPTAAGTIVALCMPLGWSTDQDGSTLFRVFDAYLAGAEKLVLRRNSSTQAILGTVDQVGGKNATAITAGFTSGALEQIASVWDATSVRAYINGTHASTDSAAPSLPFITTDTLWIGCSTSGFNPFYGYVCLVSIARALVVAELQALYVALPVLA